MNSAELCRLFSVPVAAGVATPAMYRAPLLAAESIGVATWAAKRQQEFAAGRAAARLALLSLGAKTFDIPMGPDRAPVWPLGFVGSISHCAGFCAAVAAHGKDAETLGFDVETAEPLPADALQLILGTRERSELDAKLRQTGVDHTRIAFSAKEAFYKCYYPIMRRFLDFHDVVIRFVDGPGEASLGGAFQIEFVDGAAPGAELARRMVGRWRADRKFIYTGATLEQPSRV